MLEIEMDALETNVVELAEAFERPLERLDLWLAWAPSEASTRLRKAIEAIGADDEVNRKTARLLLGWSDSSLSVTSIARQAGINSAAVSQRKSRIEGVLDDLFDDADMARHPLVALWRDRAARCVRIADLPNWMTGFLESGSGESEWGVPQDIFWVVMRAVMENPRLIESSGDQWLVDLSLDERGDNKDQLRSILDSIADSRTKTGSVVLQSEEFQQFLVDMGVSKLSIDSFTTALARVARRSVVFGDEVLLLSDVESKNLGQVAKSVMNRLGVDRAEVAGLIAEQHGRHPRSVANELRRL